MLGDVSGGAEFQGAHGVVFFRVGADDEDRGGAREVLRPGRELAGPDRVVEERRSAVAGIE